MKTVKLHFCDGKGYEMKRIEYHDFWEVKDRMVWMCPMCQLMIKDGKKTKGVLTERRSE